MYQKSYGKCVSEQGPWVSLFLLSYIDVHVLFRYQPNIRLPALDAKLAACELLIAGLERLALLDDVTDIPLAQKELCLLEQSLDHIRDTFARKIGIMQHDDDGNNQTSSNTTNNNNNNSHSIPSSPSSSTSITATKSSKVCDIVKEHHWMLTAFFSLLL